MADNTDGFDDLQRDLKRLAQGLADQKLLRQIGLGAERSIRKRTREGTGVDGQPFAAYSKRYADRKKKKLSLTTNPVNLQATLYGGSLEQMDHVLTRDLSGVEVLFRTERATEILGYHDRGEGQNPERQFFALSSQETEATEDLVGQHIDELLATLRL